MPFASVHDATGSAPASATSRSAGSACCSRAATTIVSGQGEIVLPIGQRSDGPRQRRDDLRGVRRARPDPAGHVVSSSCRSAPSSRPPPTRRRARCSGASRSARASAQERRPRPAVDADARGVADRDFVDGAATNIDVVPQLQVTLNRRQHVRVERRPAGAGHQHAPGGRSRSSSTSCGTGSTADCSRAGNDGATR